MSEKEINCLFLENALESMKSDEILKCFEKEGYKYLLQETLNNKANYPKKVM